MTLGDKQKGSTRHIVNISVFIAGKKPSGSVSVHEEVVSGLSLNKANFMFPVNVKYNTKTGVIPNCSGERLNELLVPFTAIHHFNWF